jgi:hypothetical protein
VDEFESITKVNVGPAMATRSAKPRAMGTTITAAAKHNDRQGDRDELRAAQITAAASRTDEFTQVTGRKNKRRKQRYTREGVTHKLGQVVDNFATVTAKAHIGVPSLPFRQFRAGHGGGGVPSVPWSAAHLGSIGQRSAARELYHERACVQPEQVRNAAVSEVAN